LDGNGGGGLGSGLAGLASSLGGMEPSPVARLGQEYHTPPNPGPQTATYGYPYYTSRAPRDFLMDNPPSIGY
jgi:hypothetical protein